MKLLCIVCVVFGSLWAGALDREAFTFTKYDLKVRVEPEQQRLGVRGKISLRNDSSSLRKEAFRCRFLLDSQLEFDSVRSQAGGIRFTDLYLGHRSHQRLIQKLLLICGQSGPSKVLS